MHSTAIVGLFFAATAFSAPTEATYKPKDAYTPSKPDDKPYQQQPKYNGTIDDDLPPIVPVNTRTGDDVLIGKLVNTATQVDRVNLLNQPGDFVFDFNEAAPPSAAVARGEGGATVAANARTFPALIGNNIAMTVGFLGPCGLNTPHVHNRASQLAISVKGRLVVNFQVENGVEPVQNTLGELQAAVFPQGAIHTGFNPDCEDSVFVAGFNNADPGVEQIAQTFFNLRPDIVETTLGVKTINGADVESFRDMLPDNVVRGIESCLKRCGIKHNQKRDVSEFFAVDPQ